MALLHLLNALAQEEGIALCAAHVDHGIRLSSAADAAFAKAQCDSLGIPCQVHQVHLEDSSENAARNARYQALYDAACDFGVPCIALAHHRRDQAETIMLHLVRGSGVTGLGGMAECRVVKAEASAEIQLWRPLLSVSPTDIRIMLTDRCIPWREDETNAGDQYLRNYIRHRVLPALEERVPEAETALARAAAILRREDEYMALATAEFLDRFACLEGPCKCILMQKFADLHPALRSRVVRRAFPGHLDFDTSEKLMQLSKGQQMNLPGGYRAAATETWLHFIPPEPEKIPLGAVTVLPYTGNTGDGIRCQAMPRKIWEQACLTYRQQGERIHPFGGPGNKSLQDYWVDKKVDRPFRPYLPLLCIGSQVIWSIGVGPGEEARVTPGGETVLLQYEGYLPGELPGSNK